MTLISSVLDALPFYMLSIFPVPASVIKRLDAVRRNFLWKGSEDKKKLHLVKWVELTVCKEIGGMRIRNLKKQNQGLMMKWLCKFTPCEDMLWKDVIIAKYGMMITG